MSQSPAQPAAPQRPIAIRWALPADWSDPAAQAHGLELLDAGERERFRRLIPYGPKLSYLVAHLLLRRSLSEQVRAGVWGPRAALVPPEAWRFVRDALDRPSLSEAFPDPLYFNLTHNDGLVACGVHPATELGVDAEALDRRVKVELLIPRVFTPTEQARVLAVAGDARRRRFFEHWVMKEAYLKARGLGFSLDPAEVEIMPAREPDAGSEHPRGWRVRCASDPTPGAAWQFDLWEPTPRHLLALAVVQAEGSPWEVELARMRCAAAGAEEARDQVEGKEA